VKLGCLYTLKILAGVSDAAATRTLAVNPQSPNFPQALVK
jgi:hypothetical protein